MSEDKLGRKSELGYRAAAIGMKRRLLLLGTTSLASASTFVAASPPAQAQPSQEILPKSESG